MDARTSETVTLPTRVKGLDHVVLRVADMARAIKFYGDVLGLFEERRLPDNSLVMLRAGHSMLDLQDAAKGGPVPAPDSGNMDHLCLRVEPFDETQIKRHLDAHGVKYGPTVMRYGADGNGPSIYIEDLDGNQVELKGPPV
jgi:catechol 2,3-dioxygenase-like lactoylglutathione lyase family enzyme